MDTSILNDAFTGAVNGLGGAVNPGTVYDVTAASNQLWLYAIIFLCVVVGLHILQAVLTGALARSKGYSFVGNFLLGIVLGFFALVYVAGRPVSYERECVMQDRLAIQTARELYKLQRAREKAQSGSSRPPRD